LRFVPFRNGSKALGTKDHGWMDRIGQALASARKICLNDSVANTVPAPNHRKAEGCCRSSVDTPTPAPRSNNKTALKQMDKNN
jgi:hypothetical protein